MQHLLEGLVQEELSLSSPVLGIQQQSCFSLLKVYHLPSPEMPALSLRAVLLCPLGIIRPTKEGTAGLSRTPPESALSVWLCETRKGDLHRQWNAVVKSFDSRVQLPASTSWLHHCITLGKLLTSARFSFSSCKMGTIIHLLGLL